MVTAQEVVDARPRGVKESASPRARAARSAEESSMARRFRWLVLVLVTGVLLVPGSLAAQTEPDLAKVPGQEWLTPGGNLANQRYSALVRRGDLIKRGIALIGEITANQRYSALVRRGDLIKGQWVTHLGSGLGAKYS